MKQPYQAPSFHLLPGVPGMTGEELAALSDEALEKVLRDNGFDENKKRYRAHPDFLLREIAGEAQLMPTGTAMSCMMPAARERSLPFDQQSRLAPEEAAAVRIRALKQELSAAQFTQFVMENIWAAQHILPDKGPGKMRCLAGSCSYTINWQGQMRPCVIMNQPSASVLSLGFDAAWQQIRAEADKITLSSKCSACRLRTLCRTCAASALLETGRYDGTPDYMCRYTAHTFRLLLDEVSALARQQKP